MQSIRDLLKPARLYDMAALGLLRGIVHLLGVSTIFVLSAAWVLPGETRAALWSAYDTGALGMIPVEALIHLGLSVAAWLMLYIGFRLLTSVPEQSTPRLVKAQGTVIVETIIVLPVLLLLIFGLLQLIVLNTAGLLSTLASYNAARVVAVWGPEAEIQRNDVDESLVAEKARVAAAAAVAPVAPSDYFMNLSGCNESGDTLEHFINGLEMDYGVGIGPISFGPAGHTQFHNTAPMTGATGNLSVPRGFDTSDFETRGQRKMHFAYCAMTVQLSNAATGEQECSGDLCGEVDTPTDDNEDASGATIAYQQHMAFPIAERVFGSGGTVGGRLAYYSTITRSHTFNSQMEPSDQVPGGIGGTIQNIADSL